MIGALPWEVGLVRSPKWEWVLLVAILCLAAGLRLWRLDVIPPGLTHDEAGHGQDAIAILHGARPLYETIGYGREPLYDYVVGAAMALLGRSDYLVLRGVSAAFGLLTIVTTYLWVRRAFGQWEAILTAGWLAGSFWAVSTSRQALRSVMLPALLAAAVYAWWRGAFDGDDQRREKPCLWRCTIARKTWFLISGLCVAASLWTYMAARVTWALFLVFPLFLWVTRSLRSSDLGLQNGQRPDVSHRPDAFHPPHVVDRSDAAIPMALCPRGRCHPPDVFHPHWPGMLLTLVVAGVVAAPMFIWLQQHPGAEQRFSQLGRPLQLLAAGDVGQIWTNSLEALGMFTLRADDLWVYNIPGRPWLGAVEGALFYLGVALAIWRWRRPQYALALMWLVVGLSPSLITGVSASATRAVAILPVLYLFPALTITETCRWIRSHGCLPSAHGCLPSAISNPRLKIGHRTLDIGHWTLVILRCSLVIVHCSFLLLPLLSAARTTHDYFDVWGNAPDVRVAYHTTLFEIARDLDRQDIPPDTVVVVSSIYPGRYHDPYAWDLILSRQDLSMRWVDGRGALIFPADSADQSAHSRLIVKALAPLDPALAQAVASPYARLIESRLLRPDDLNPGFDVYEWDSAAALEALLAGAAHRPVAWSSSPTLPADDPQSVYRSLALPADLGHTVALLGYEISFQVDLPGEELDRTSSIRRMSSIRVVTYWQVLSVPDFEGEAGLDVVLFTHLLNPGGDPPLIAQQDRLDAPAWNWHAGEVFAQVHHLVIADGRHAGDELPPGLYPVEVGAYTRSTPSPIEPDPPAIRLPLYVDGQAVSDRILLPPLHVMPQDGQ